MEFIADNHGGGNNHRSRDTPCICGKILGSFEGGARKPEVWRQMGTQLGMPGW